MIYQLKVTLKDVRPPIWRRVQVSGDLTLSQLHRVLQIVMGWTDSHLHQFIIDDERYATPSPDDWGEPASDERKFRLHDLPKATTRFQYEYDFGDGWEHDVQVEKILPSGPKSAAVCVDGRRACPPEDCGGPWGYGELLEILADPKHEEYAERMEWLGGKFEAEEFDVLATNSILSKHGPRRGRASG